MSMECGLGFWDLVHNYSHFITSVLHNFGSALYIVPHPKIPNFLIPNRLTRSDFVPTCLKYCMQLTGRFVKIFNDSDILGFYDL